MSLYLETVGIGYGPTDNSRVCATALNICRNGLYYKLMSISLLYLHLDLVKGQCGHSGLSKVELLSGGQRRSFEEDGFLFLPQI